MRKFTLIAIAALISVMAFAQRQARLPQARVFERAVLQVAPVQKTLKTTATQQSRMAKAPEAGTLVEPPSGVTPETYYTNGGQFYKGTESGWSNATKDMSSINVAIDGTDIYIQGLAYWFDEAWVKGTLNGTTATFANGQLVGEDEYGPEYIVGSDDGKTLSEAIVFTFDSTNGVLEATTTYILESGSATEVSAYCYWENAVFTKEKPAEPETVTLPEGVELKEYALSYTDYDGNAASGKAAVGIDGNDVYIQGFSSYIPEALIKGTKEGNTITFPAEQYLGTYSGYDSYFIEEAVFTYDAATDTYTAEGDVYSLLGSQYIDVYATNPVLKGVIEKAAMPANPSITGMKNGSYGWYITFNVPNVDVNGDGMITSKLSYIIYTDTEGEIAPLTFTPDTHSELTEEMTEIPYGFSENYDFYDTQIYLNDLYSSAWNNIGIQSIYTGGGETNKTEIQWYHIKDYASASGDYTWVAAEQGYENGEEVASITIGEDVTGTLDKGEGTLDPKYYNSGTALRMYAGNTLTITAEKPMVKIVFTMTGNATQMSLEADKGEYSLEGTTGTWTGEADEVVFTVPNVSGNQARIQMIEIFFAGSEGPKLVEVPEDLVVESYFFQGFDTYYEEDIESQVEVGFYGENEVYFHNLSSYVDDNWVKGTIEGNVVTIPTTYLGVYQSFFGDMDLSFNGATFIYDAQTGTFTAEEGFTTSADGYDGLFMDEYTNVVLSKIIEKEATPADPEVASFKLYNEPKEGDTELTLATYPSVKFNIPMKDVEGNAMLQEKMSYIIYIVDGEGIQKELTLTTDLYEELTEDLTEIPYTFTDDYDIAPGGSTVYLNQNPEEIATWKKIGVKNIYRGMDIEHSSAIAWYSIEDYIADLNKLITTAITSVNAANKQDARYYDLQGRSVEQGQKGLLIMQYTDGQGNVKTAKVVRK